MARRKVFCVGVSKTATTSFGDCMTQLGYHHLKGFDTAAADLYLNGDLRALDRIAAAYDSFDDWPWPSMFERYAALYPDAKFVLTTRKTPEIWLKSYMMHCESQLLHWAGFERYNRAFFGAAYPHGQEAAHIRAYLNHIRAVETYFAAQKERLLHLCFETDDVWQKLSEFLGEVSDEETVPHVNKKEIGKPPRRYIKRSLLRAYGRIEKATGITCEINYRQ